MKKEETVNITARYDCDTKRTHRFLLETVGGVSGSIYVSKDVDPLPEKIALTLKMKGD